MIHMLSAGGDIHKFYFAALVGKVCLVQPLKQTGEEVEGFLVVVKVHDCKFPFLLVIDKNISCAKKAREKETESADF